MRTSKPRLQVMAVAQRARTVHPRDHDSHLLRAARVAPGADQAALAVAYKKLARTLHPDMAGGSSALFGIVTEARRSL